MTEFETALEVCLEALTEGRWDLDECLRRYPEHSAELRPHLLATVTVMHAYDARPSEAFARAARERFLVATGQRLQEAYDAEPEPSFFAAARVRFLMTAQRVLRRPEPARRLPLFGSPARALGGALAALAIFLSFSTYTVASASSALPGDWRYPIKLETERVRLALAFSEDARRDVRLDRAEERTREIEKLAQKGKIIGPGVLDRLAEQTKPLVEDAADGGWDADAYNRLHDVAETQKQVLDKVAPQVDPEAQPQLAKAEEVAKDAATVTFTAIVATSSAPVVITPSVLLHETPSATSTPVPPTDTPVATPSAAPGELPPASTPTAEPTATATEVRSGTELVVFDETIWIRMQDGGFSALVPFEASRWRNDTSAAAGQVLVRIANSDSSSLITLNTHNGDMYWYVLHNGRFDEVQMRQKTGDQTLVIDRDALRAAYGSAVDVPLFVLDSIEFTPPASPTPEPTNTPVPSPR